MPLRETLSQHIVQSDDVWSVDDLLQSPWRDYNARNGTVWRGLIATRLRVGGAIGGTFALASAAPRAVPLSAADRDFLRIVAVLLASIIDRGRQSEKLDSLAFSIR